ncbi:hypothetical protein [Streptomyces sp. NPDC057686]|uniref:hypothetical protein n=1 Tax=Streptomyces sp. NPDC057686 TaxID=3346212 RepID=UPI00369430AC
MSRTPPSTASGVEEGGQVPAAGQSGHLVRVDVGELGLAAEVDQKAGTDQVADR